MSNKQLGLRVLHHIIYGTSVMLYGSRYKKVDILPNKPYFFTEEDDTSEEALEFYKSLRKKIGVELFELHKNEDPSDEQELTQEFSNEVVEEVKPVVEDSVEEDKVVEDSSEEVKQDEVDEVQESSVNLDELTHNELAEHIDTNYDDDFKRTLIGEVSPNTKIGRSKVSNVLSSVIDSNKDDVVNYLKSHQ